MADLDEMSLPDIWARIAEATEVQEETARLESFWLLSGANGSLQRLPLVFHGLNEQGRQAVYAVSLGANDVLRWREQVVEQAERNNIRRETPWLTITICEVRADDTKGIEVTRGDSSAAVSERVTAGASDVCEIWFLEQTAERAEQLELE